MRAFFDSKNRQNEVSSKGPVQNLTALTSLCFFAALFVVIHHIAEAGNKIYLIQVIGQFGWLGVSFFFILSGFVLMWSFDSRMTPSKYILRRLSRIYPLHFVCLTICLLLFFKTGHVFGGYPGSIAGTLANFLLVHDWIPGHPNIRQAWNGVSWTLSCEFFFYLIAPFCFPTLARIGWGKAAWVVAAAWLGFLALLVAANAEHRQNFLDLCFYNPLSRSGEFILGAIGAQWLKTGLRFTSPLGAVVLMTVPILLYCDYVPEPFQCSNVIDMLFIPGAFLLIIAIAGNQTDGLTSWLNRRMFVLLGDSSFALYMIHAIILGIFTVYAKKYFSSTFYQSTQFELFFVSFFCAVTVLFSILVHLKFELPTRDKLLKILARHSA
jgi:peptidoglycan/LPS O-acetylase OafA/YrhL